jgi:hypothetical protein
MWTDFDEPPYTTLTETVAARQRMRSKKRRKQPPRSKRKSNGAPHAASNKLTFRKPALSTGSAQRAGSVTQTDPVILDFEAFRDEQSETPKTSILQVTPTPGAPGDSAAHVCSPEIKQCENLAIDDLAVSPAHAALISPVEIRGRPTATMVPSVIVGTEPQASKQPFRRRVRKQVRSVVLGSIAVGGALWFLSSVPHLKIEPVITADRNPTSVRVWTDPTPLKQVQAAAEVAPVTAQPKQAAIVATTGLTAVTTVPAEVGVEVDRPTNHRLVESNSIGVVSSSQDVVQSVSIGSVPLPPRRPMSLLVRHMLAAHPIGSMARMPAPASIRMSAPASIELPADRTEPSESYTNFSSREHEIGTHKLAWGMARLHEDANSSSGRGAVWDFVPSEP